MIDEESASSKAPPFVRRNKAARRWAMRATSIALGVGVAASMLAANEAAGADGAVAATDDSVDADVAVANDTLEPASAAVLALRNKAAGVRALVANELPVDVRPADLFDIDLADASMVVLEAARLRTMLSKVERDAGGFDARGDVAIDADATFAESAPSLDPSLWEARVDLDRARLAFYDLSSDARKTLLAAHAKRVAEAIPPPDEDALRAARAEAERQKALQAAREARSEAERIVSEQYAHLLGVEASLVAFDEQLAVRRRVIEARREATLGWLRRTKELRAKGGADLADATYDDLRKALREARDQADAALADLAGAPSGVPSVGPDPLADLQTHVDMRQPQDARARIELESKRLSAEESRVRQDSATQLIEEIDVLNRERLALLPFLSPARRSAITGFTSAGLDQAASELRQLRLIVRYQWMTTRRWWGALRDPDQSVAQSVGSAVFEALKWIAVVSGFLWARRRIPALLTKVHERQADIDRRERLPNPSIVSRAITFVRQIHRPVEWLALALFLSWILPASAKQLLQVQLVAVIVQWVLGGALVVDVVNALASGGEVRHGKEASTAALRLRSLRLVGRVVVLFGLILALSSRLVGQGTIYQWVLSTCWFASIPLVLVLLRWWREVVFHRVERTRKKTTFEQWVLENRTGWKSFLAATSGGVYVFGRGAARATRSWISRFQVTRRVLAYLFRRELDKLGAERAPLATNPIPKEAFDSLGPSASSAEWLATAADDALAALSARLRDRRGGVVVLVGQRGAGKTTALRRLVKQFPDTIHIDATPEGTPALRRDVAQKLGLGRAGSLDEVAKALAASPNARALFVDDIQHFVQPMMGGLARFDELLSAVGRHCADTTWVFTLDEMLWLFLVRARGDRPLFDEVIHLTPWSEEQIVALLRHRTEHAKLRPCFEGLLEKLPPNADDIDKQEALAQRELSYYRLLWDHAGGNPGVSLHMWRRSLGVDAEGVTHALFFDALDSDDLRRLPDSAVFVLRAVLQLAPAHPEDIARATMLDRTDVSEALRYAAARGYVDRVEDRYVVTWTWLRALTVFLQRRHLSVGT